MESSGNGRVLWYRNGDGRPALRFGTSLLERPPDRALQLGAFPLAPSIRVEPSGPSTALVRLDAIGAFPLFVAGTPAVLGDSLPEVAAHADATGLVDPVTVIGRIAFECDIGPHTLLAGVRRMLPTEVAEVDFARGTVTIANASPEAPHPDPLEFLIGLAGSAFRDGADLELTGGYDSRLVLALGCAAGFLPRTAITMGEPGGFDVENASRITRCLGIPHRVLPFPRLEDPDWEAIRRFWLRTGCAVDPFEYAWIPAIFGSEFPSGRTQVAGVGGEIGSGFYAFRGDEALLRLMGWRRLIRHRMAKRGHDVVSLGPDGERLLEAAVSRVMDRVEDARGWREFGLRIYSGTAAAPGRGRFSPARRRSTDRSHRCSRASTGRSRPLSHRTGGGEPGSTG